MSYLSNSINAATMGLRLAAGTSPGVVPGRGTALPTAQELTTGSGGGTGKVNWMLVVGGLAVGGGLLWLLLRKRKKSSRRDEED